MLEQVPPSYWAEIKIGDEPEGRYSRQRYHAQGGMGRILADVALE